MSLQQWEQAIIAVVDELIALESQWAALIWRGSQDGHRSQAGDWTRLLRAVVALRGRLDQIEAPPSYMRVLTQLEAFLARDQATLSRRVALEAELFGSGQPRWHLRGAGRRVAARATFDGAAASARQERLLRLVPVLDRITVDGPPR